MHRIIIQQAAENVFVPAADHFEQWANQALLKEPPQEVTIRIVSSAEMAELNDMYRGKNYATNVLSFPFEMPDEVEFETLGLDMPILGDIVICAETVNREAQEQHKTADAHWAHMVVHGIFHLLGYDHEIDSEAEIMEDLEKAVMQQLGFPNPYKDQE